MDRLISDRVEDTLPKKAIRNLVMIPVGYLILAAAGALSKAYDLYQDTKDILVGERYTK